MTIGTLDARHHFGDGWSADASLPIGSVRYDPGLDRPALRLSGFGDVQLGGRYDFGALWGAGGYLPSVTLRAGLGLPSGTQATLQAPNVPPNLLAIGEATWSVSGRLTFDEFLARWVAVGGWLDGTVPIGRTQAGLRFGERVGYGLGATFLPISELAVSLHLTGEHRNRADEASAGVVISSGGHSLAAQLWAGLRIGDALNVGVGGRVPFHQRVGGTQITETFSLFASIGLTFGGEDEDEHDHDHGDEHEDGSAPKPASGTSTNDLAVGGASFALAEAAVPSKVTVIDFWAEWCAPCEQIDALLREMAEENSELAVRRVEVPSFDSPVARAHLKGVSALPVIWIFDRSGNLLEKLDGIGPDDVRAKVERHLRQR